MSRKSTAANGRRKISSQPMTAIVETDKDRSPSTSTLRVVSDPNKSDAAVVADLVVGGLSPVTSVLVAYSEDTFSKGLVDLSAAHDELVQLSGNAARGDLAHAERLLSGQMLALNSIFAGLANRAKANAKAGYMGASETYLRLALKAQAQCRQTAETLFEMKNPRPVAFIQQANVSNGPQQVNNGARTGQIESAPSKLLEDSIGQRMDTRATGKTGRADPILATVGKVNGTAHN